jgi:hypothetical protein
VRLSDELAARGEAVITSSTSDEQARESDALRGSYFTHHWVSGLRGAADRSRDGRVTLAEAYDYAYGRTVAQAEGGQHPTFKYDLTGQGDLVLTSLSDAGAWLVFGGRASGRYFIFAGDGSMIGEIDVNGGMTRVAVPPGNYRILKREPIREMRVAVRSGEARPVDDAELSVMQSEWTGIAKSAAPSPKQLYPASILERPMILPKWMFQLSAEVGVTNSYGNGEVVTAALDVGILPRLQAGLLIAAPVNPIPNFGTLLVNAQIRLHRDVNLRFDVGAEQVVSGDPTQPYNNMGFVFGVGAPIKIKLLRWLAFVSGNTSVRGFSLRPIPDYGGGFYGYSWYTSNDILTCMVATVDPADTTGVSGFFALTLPAGLLFQPHERFSIEARVAYRLSLSVSNSQAEQAHLETQVKHDAPFGVSLVFNVIRPLDVGFSASIFELGAQRQFDFWVAARF